MTPNPAVSSLSFRECSAGIVSREWAGRKLTRFRVDLFQSEKLCSKLDFVIAESKSNL
jgi:hypothetical protein